MNRENFLFGLCGLIIILGVLISEGSVEAGKTMVLFGMIAIMKIAFWD